MPQDKGPVEFRVMQNRQEVMQEGKRTKSKNGQIEPLPIHQGWKGHQGQKGAKISCQDAARVQKNVCGPIGRITLQVDLQNAELLKVDIRVGNKCHEKILILFGLCYMQMHHLFMLTDRVLLWSLLLYSLHWLYKLNFLLFFTTIRSF